MGLPSPLIAAMSAMVLSVATTAYALRKPTAVVAAASREECRKSRRFMETSLFDRRLPELCHFARVDDARGGLPGEVGSCIAAAFPPHPFSRRLHSSPQFFALASRGAQRIASLAHPCSGHEEEAHEPFL